jgi:hypothetical protein
MTRLIVKFFHVHACMLAVRGVYTIAHIMHIASYRCIHVL